MILDFGYICMEFQVNLANSLSFPCSVTSEKSRIDAGGRATNQAIAAARSGAKVSLIGTIGNDLFGKTILAALRREGIHSSGIAKSEKPTGIINSIIDGDKQRAMIFSDGANVDISPQQIPDILLNERALMLLQNDLPPHINMDVLKRAKRRDARSMMCLSNADNIDPEFFDHLDIVVTKGDIFEIPITQKNVHHIIAKDLSAGCPRAFDSFCGTLAACVQARTSLDLAIKYSEIAAKLTSGYDNENNNFPYLGDIEKQVA